MRSQHDQIPRWDGTLQSQRRALTANYVGEGPPVMPTLRKGSWLGAGTTSLICGERAGDGTSQRKRLPKPNLPIPPLIVVRWGAPFWLDWVQLRGRNQPLTPVT